MTGFVLKNTHNVLIVCRAGLTVAVVVSMVVVVARVVVCGHVMLRRRGGGEGSLRGEWGNTCVKCRFS